MLAFRGEVPVNLLRLRLIIFDFKVIASLMAAPGSLWVSKAIYPETKQTKATWDSIQNLPKGLENINFKKK